jgi:hypothetical protein
MITLTAQATYHRLARSRDVGPHTAAGDDPQDDVGPVKSLQDIRGRFDRGECVTPDDLCYLIAATLRGCA